MTAGLREKLRERRRAEERAAFEAAWSAQDARLARSDGSVRAAVPVALLPPVPAEPVGDEPAPPRTLRRPTPIAKPAATEFGARLRAFRERAGLTQAELARQCGVDGSCVSALESGRRDGSWKLVRRIADALALDGPERAALLAAVGGVASQTGTVAHPHLRRIDALLNDPAVSAQTKQSMTEVLRAVILLGERAGDAGSKEGGDAERD